MKILYLGTNPKNYPAEVTHLPLIEIVARPFTNFSIKSAVADVPEYTHTLFTSKNTVPIYLDALAYWDQKPTGQLLALGEATAEAMREAGLEPDLICEIASQEGMIHELALLDLDDAYLFIPGSARARPALSQYLRVRQIRHQMCPLYDTIAAPPTTLPEIGHFDRVVFTSPSTVEAFVQAYGALPQGVEVESIGPITQIALSHYAR